MNRLTPAIIALSFAWIGGGCGGGTEGTGTDAGVAVDSGMASSDGGDAGPAGDDMGVAGDDMGVAGDAGACVSVHPIIGPPRTCELGSCLCIDTDACYTADVVDACCAGTFECAAPPTTCMATHPIVGPPRTCPSGGCFCANPDACFPAASPASCCAVPLVCVP